MTGDHPNPAASPRSPASPWLVAVAAGFIVLAAFAAWHNSLHAPFVFDDRAAILDNPTIRNLGSIGSVLSPPAGGRSVSGRPLVNFSLACNYWWSGTDPWSYHAFNLAVHVLAGLALFGLVRRTLLHRSSTGSAPSGIPRHTELPVALAVALLWTLHPLQTESVTCVVQRTESLCGLFYLLTIYGFVRAVGSTHAGRWLVFSTAACWLGMGTKEVMVSAPLLVLLCDRTFFAGSFAAAWRMRRNYYGALACSWLLLLWLVLAGGGTRGTAAGLGVGMSPWAYLLTQCKAIVLYVKLSFWPHPLVLDYGTAIVQSVTEVWWQGICVVALLAATLVALWRRPVAGFLGACFFVILAPSSSVVPLASQTIAEHRMYLPLAAVIIAVVTGALALAGRRVLPGFLVLSLLAGWLTWQRNEIYRSELTLWSDTVAKCPANPRALANLGSVLMELNRIPEAVACYEKAEQLRPDSPVVHSNLCHAYARLGRLAEAVQHGNMALRLDADYTDAHVNLAHALVKIGRADEAAGHYETALRLQPDALDLHLNLADVLVDLGREAEAITHYEAAMALGSRRSELHCKLAVAYSKQGDLSGARSHCSEALRLNPDNTAALFVWGNLCAGAGDFAPAITAYRRAVTLDPGYIAARNNLANALLVTRHLDEAIKEYREIVRQNPDDRSVQENLQLALELQAAQIQPR